VDVGNCPALEGGGWDTAGPTRAPSELTDHGTADPDTADPDTADPGTGDPGTVACGGPAAAPDPRSADQVEFSGARLPTSTAAVTPARLAESARVNARRSLARAPLCVPGDSNSSVFGDICKVRRRRWRPDARLVT